MKIWGMHLRGWLNLARFVYQHPDLMSKVYEQTADAQAKRDENPLTDEQTQNGGHVPE